MNELTNGQIYITFLCMDLAEAFIQSDLNYIQHKDLISTCFLWELNPWPCGC